MNATTSKTHRIRTIDFHPYFSNQDPTASSADAFKAYAPHKAPQSISVSNPQPSTAGKPQSTHMPTCEHLLMTKISIPGHPTGCTVNPDKLLPRNIRLILLTMAYRYKRDKNGHAVKLNVQCPARGDTMLPHVRYNPIRTTTYMVEKFSMRLLFAIPASHKLHIEHIDIEAAYLHEKIDHSVQQPVYVRQHPFLTARTNARAKEEMSSKPSIAHPRLAGYAKLTAVIYLLHRHVFHHSEFDPFLFHKITPTTTTFVAISIADFTVAATPAALLDEFESIFATAYTIKRLSEPRTPPGWTVNKGPRRIPPHPPTHGHSEHNPQKRRFTSPTASPIRTNTEATSTVPPRGRTDFVISEILPPDTRLPRSPNIWWYHSNLRCTAAAVHRRFNTPQHIVRREPPIGHL